MTTDTRNPPPPSSRRIPAPYRSTVPESKRLFDVTVQALDQLDCLPPQGWMEDTVTRALAVAEAADGSSVSVVIADDEVVRELNRDHRGLDETTDVLAFSFVHEGEYYGEPGSRPPIAEDSQPFALPPGETEPLGEIVVSYPQARRQASQAGHSIQREMAALLTHGVLHLMGHDHLEPSEEAAMKALEDRILSEVLLAIGPD